MPLFGAHVSAKGGPYKAAERAAALGMEAVQLFTKNANAWAAKPIPDDEARRFREAVVTARLRYPTAHDSYLINLATPDDDHRRKSLDAFTDELGRAEALGLSYLVSHPGAHMGSGEVTGLARVVAGLDEVHARCRGFGVQVLIETTVGQGTTLGGRFEHLRVILDRVKESERVGVCLDTCHVFAAGYPLGTRVDYAATFEEFEQVVGLKHLRLFHVNDSVAGLGSRIDRHAGIGLGQIGLDAFRMLVTDSRFAEHPMILETPKEDDDGNESMDAVNLDLLRGFRSAARAE